MEQLQQLENALTKLKNKESKIYFLTQDTNGNAAASVNSHLLYQNILKIRKNLKDQLLVFILETREKQ
jgi:hypothetical protein